MAVQYVSVLLCLPGIPALLVLKQSPNVVSKTRQPVLHADYISGRFHTADHTFEPANPLVSINSNYSDAEVSLARARYHPT